MFGKSIRGSTTLRGLFYFVISIYFVLKMVYLFLLLYANCDETYFVKLWFVGSNYSLYKYKASNQIIKSK